MTKSRTNVFNAVQKLLEPINKKLDLTHELQTEIDPNIWFRRNSVNLLVGKKGGGKTYNVFRECLKLRFIKNHRYTKMLYITNKPDDPTFSRVEALMPFIVEKVPYADAVAAITNLSMAKSAMREMKAKKISTSQLQDEAKAQLEAALGESVTRPEEVYHTIVLLDDCQHMFDHPTKENKELFKLLFENRQPKITYFLTCQDPKGMDSSLKEALDGIWIFGGFTRHKFSYLLRNIPHEETGTKLWKTYKDLSKNQAMMFLNGDDGCDVQLLME